MGYFKPSVNRVFTVYFAKKVLTVSPLITKAFGIAGLVAQLVEQWTLNPAVVGSIPTGPTKILFCDTCALSRYLFSKDKTATRKSLVSPRFLQKIFPL